MLERLREQRWFQFLAFAIALIVQLTVGLLWHIWQFFLQTWFFVRDEAPDHAKAWWHNVKLLASLFKKDR